MKIACTLLPCLIVILHFIESTSASKRSSHAEPGARSRPRSPTLGESFPSVLGYRFEDLALIRLRPHYNRNRVFELRRYAFPRVAPIGLRTRGHVLLPMPVGDQIVLSKSNGDVCAILEKSTCRHTVLRAIFEPTLARPVRAKINMNSGEVEALTEQEIAECPASTHNLVAKDYEVSLLGLRGTRNPSARQYEASSSSSAIPRRPVEPTVRDKSRSPTLRRAFPGVFGFSYDDLEFIRLTPVVNPDRIFELRKYAFPPDIPIGLKTKNGILVPVPTGNQIVVSTQNGDVCAVLRKSSTKIQTIRPILTSDLGIYHRVKINMSSGAVERMTKEESAECPGTSGKPVPESYHIFRV